MLEEKYISDFSFLGKRNYIQGHELLDFTIQSIRQFYRIENYFSINYFKIYEEVSTNIYLTHNKESNLKPLAEQKYFLNNSSNKVFLMPYSNQKIKKRCENMVMPVQIKNCNYDFSGLGYIEKADTFLEVLSSIVEVNKQIHLLSLRKPDYDPKIRVVFFNNFDTYQNHDSMPLEVKIDCKNRKSYRGLEYSISTVSWMKQRKEFRMEICFSFDRK
jgi:hypothetical protein